MANLQTMPPIVLPASRLMEPGKHWNATTTELPKTHGEQVGKLCDETVGNALARMLGGIPIRKPGMNSLLPPAPDCVEVGPTRVIGGIRPQNFDVAYRPDGIRFAYDSKTLNGRESVGKNYQNMVNDLGAEATTVHARFASAIVAFIIAVPEPCLGNHARNLIAALTRLCGRDTLSGDLYKAEAIGLVVWHPDTGGLDANWPPVESPLRIEKFSRQIEACYSYRYAGQPPHNAD
ncbi:MAG: hypothetical protein ACLQU4_09650 [Limisphaerales bacterium]